MALPILTGEFRLVADPELRFTPSGKGVASVRLVASKPKKVEENGESSWVDDKVCWLNGTLWNSDKGNEAENLCESLVKGDLVEIRGALETRNYETKDGEKRVSLDVNLYAIGPSLKWNTAKVNRTKRERAPQEAPQGGSAAVADDPWATAPSSSEPPF